VLQTIADATGATEPETANGTLATLDQDVSDPFESSTITQIERTEGQPGSERPHQEGEFTEALRGNAPIRNMKSWKEMGKWLLKFDTDKNIFPGEISRMWTHMVAARSDAHPLSMPACLAQAVPFSDGGAC
jgi:hypothetical protein